MGRLLPFHPCPHVSFLLLLTDTSFGKFRRVPIAAMIRSVWIKVQVCVAETVSSSPGVGRVSYTGSIPRAFISAAWRSALITYEYNIHRTTQSQTPCPISCAVEVPAPIQTSEGPQICGVTPTQHTYCPF